MTDARPRPRLAAALAALLIAGAWGASVGTGQDELALVALLLLGLLAAAGELASSRLAATAYTTGTGMAVYLAAVRYGPMTAMGVATLGHVLCWAVDRYRPLALLTNVANLTASACAAGLVVAAVPEPTESWGWLLAGAGATIVGEVVNVLVASLLIGLQDGVALRRLLSSLRSLSISVCVEAGFVGFLAGADADNHLRAVAIALLLIAVYAYMSRLVTRAYEQSAIAAQRAQRYLDLSLGVLSSLVHTLGARDARAARHCAAVARYARDLAAAVGCDEHEQEVAHTAGLLHDIGRFTLSDRVLDGTEALTDEDWEQIHEHPVRGAELLRDLDAYGPIADIVAAHHEQVGGHGYPRGLRGDEIPLLARIIAVCEVYDTLTAPDTYRSPPLSSFEAIRELRRVAGTQLDPELVEAFAALLAGTGTDYRHATAVDYDAELEVQRAMMDRLEPKAPLL